MRRSLAALALAAGALLAGCHARFVDATVVNDTPAPLKTVEVDYPGGSFGTSSIAPGGHYAYHFKALGGGVLQLSFTDARGAQRQFNGPAVQAESAGTLLVRVEPGGHVQWVLKPH